MPASTARKNRRALATITDNNKRNSPFLQRLPQELRDEIYKAVLGSNNTLRALRPDFRNPKLAGSPAHFVALSLVCRQISTEVEKYFWKNTTFQVKNAQAFVDLVGERRSNLITSFTMTFAAAQHFSEQKSSFDDEDEERIWLMEHELDGVASTIFPDALKNLRQVEIQDFLWAAGRPQWLADVEAQSRRWFGKAGLKIVYNQGESRPMEIFY